MIHRIFDTDNFEQLLREKSDEFRLYPTMRIWQSIYNNIHPGRRWPSITMSILLISALPLIGYLNSGNKKITASVAHSNTIINSKNIYIAENIFKSTANITIADVGKNNIVNAISSANPGLNKAIIVSDGHYLSIHALPNNESLLMSGLRDNKNSTDLPAKNVEDNTVVEKAASNKDAENNAGKNTETSKTFIDTYFKNQGIAKKWSNKLAWQIYATPSVVYGGFFNSQETNNLYNQAPSMGLEAGTAMQYALSDIIKVKAGLQFNYASYNMQAFQSQSDHAENTAPSDPSAAYSESRNADGSSITLHNETYQFSLPLGLELKLLKNNNLQWNAGATIQPTFIAGGNAYLLSADDHNYIDESSLVNRWNLNAGFEIFVTYKSKDVTWQLGPQVRYQFLSTYGKGYSPANERLATYGVKIGVSKLLH